MLIMLIMLIIKRLHYYIVKQSRNGYLIITRLLNFKRQYDFVTVNNIIIKWKNIIIINK